MTSNPGPFSGASTAFISQAAVPWTAQLDQRILELSDESKAGAEIANVVWGHVDFHDRNLPLILERAHSVDQRLRFLRGYYPKPNLGGLQHPTPPTRPNSNASTNAAVEPESTEASIPNEQRHLRRHRAAHPGERGPIYTGDRARAANGRSILRCAGCYHHNQVCDRHQPCSACVKFGDTCTYEQSAYGVEPRDSMSVREHRVPRRTGKKRKRNEMELETVVEQSAFRWGRETRAENWRQMRSCDDIVTFSASDDEIIRELAWKGKDVPSIARALGEFQARAQAQVSKRLNQISLADPEEDWMEPASLESTAVITMARFSSKTPNQQQVNERGAEMVAKFKLGGIASREIHESHHIGVRRQSISPLDLAAGGNDEDPSIAVLSRTTCKEVHFLMTGVDSWTSNQPGLARALRPFLKKFDVLDLWIATEQPMQNYVTNRGVLTCWNRFAAQDVVDNVWSVLTDDVLPALRNRAVEMLLENHELYRSRQGRPVAQACRSHSDSHRIRPGRRSNAQYPRDTFFRGSWRSGL